MFTQHNKISLKKTVVLATLAVGCAVLAGCQTYPYSKVENDVYNCANKFSRKIPKGFVEEGKETEGSSEVYWYHDRSLVVEDIPQSGKGRAVAYQLYYGFSKLLAGYVDEDGVKPWLESEGKDRSKLKANSLIGFEARRSTGEEGWEGAIDGDSYILQKDADAVVYFRKEGGRVWKRYELADMSGLFTFEKEELYGATRVRTEQVQRYIDLAKRFDKTYSLKPQLD